MNKKKVIILIFIFFTLLFIFLFRVSIYNFINVFKVKNSLNLSMHDAMYNTFLNYDYKVEYCISSSETSSKKSSFYKSEDYYFYTDKDKVMYSFTKKSKLPSIGNSYYNIIKIKKIQDGDIDTLKKYLNNKDNLPKEGSITIISKTAQGYLSNKSKAPDLYEILERIKK